MGQPQSRSEERKAYDHQQVLELVKNFNGESVTWKPGFEVSSVDYQHVLNILKKYHHDYKIKWQYYDYQNNKNNKEGYFDGTSLPSMRHEDDGGNSDSDFYQCWAIYPSTFTFYKRIQQDNFVIHASEIIPLQSVIGPVSDIYLQQPSAPDSAYFQPPTAPAQVASAPVDNYTSLEWKTQEYKAELTAAASYLMFERTNNAAYLMQAGEWKKIKNLAQDQKVAKQEFNKLRDILYAPPYNLPIHDDIKDCAKYNVLRQWILRDGVESDKQKILEAYPKFNTFQQYENYCNDNNNLMPQMLTYLNEISCSIQGAKSK